MDTQYTKKQKETVVIKRPTVVCNRIYSEGKDVLILTVFIIRLKIIGNVSINGEDISHHQSTASRCKVCCSLICDDEMVEWFYLTHETIFIIQHVI